MFERVAVNLGQSYQLPRPINKAGKPYGKSQYHLTSFNKAFSRKSLPLGYRWPSCEPNSLLDCDHPECEAPAAASTKRLTCGHTFHHECLKYNECSICLENIIKDIQQLSHAWNIQLLKPVEDDNIHIEDGGDDNGDDPDDDDDNGSPTSKDYNYFKSNSFKEYIHSKLSSIKASVHNSKQSPEE